MLLKREQKKWLITAVAGIGIAAAAGFFVFKGLNSSHRSGQPQPPSGAVPQPEAAAPPSGVVKGKIQIKPDIDYDQLKNQGRLKKMMGERKESLGIKESLDMIVQPDESFTVGDTRVSMRDILEKSKLRQGGIFTEKIESSGAVTPKKKTAYGIYVVQSGDNIWNIHFNILKDYYEHKGIAVSPKADEPIKKGLSSGVGKILKFSETMVMIYNMKEERVDTSIDLIEPLSKIVVYNMDEVFSLLSQINYENIDRIQFDGKTIWIPAKK